MMKSLLRYFFHFSLIVFVLAILLFFIGKPHLSLKRMILCFAIAIAGYAFPMSLFFSSQATPITIVIEGEPIEICERLDTELRLKRSRICIGENEQGLTYAYALKETSPFTGFPLITRYCRWITNEVIITVGDSNVTVEGPRAILEKISN